MFYTRVKYDGNAFTPGRPKFDIGHHINTLIRTADGYSLKLNGGQRFSGEAPRVRLGEWIESHETTISKQVFFLDKTYFRPGCRVVEYPKRPANRQPQTRPISGYGKGAVIDTLRISHENREPRIERLDHVVSSWLRARLPTSGCR